MIRKVRLSRRLAVWVVAGVLAIGGVFVLASSASANIPSPGDIARLWTAQHEHQRMTVDQNLFDARLSLCNALPKQFPGFKGLQRRVECLEQLEKWVGLSSSRSRSAEAVLGFTL